MVPFVDLGPYVELVRSGHWHPTRSPFAEDVAYQLNTHEFIGGGPTTQAFEAALAKKLDVQHAVACANGTDAIQLALRACDIKRGRVALPGITFWAPFEAIVNAGATPVLLDIDEADFQLSFDELVRADRAKPLAAVVLPHLFGWCSARLLEIRAFCAQRNIPLIEDGAQAFGVRCESEPVFRNALISTLSFFPAKVIGGIGDGGAVLTNDPRLAARVRLLANHGRSAHFEHDVVGWNSRMDAIQAAWLLRALDVSDKVIEERRRLARLHGYPAGPHVVPPMNVDDNGYLQLNMLREHEPYAVQQRLHDLGVEGRRLYPVSVADQPGAKRLRLTTGPLPNSRRFAKHAFCLPLWYGMTDAQVEHCTKAFEEATRR